MYFIINHNQCSIELGDGGRKIVLQNTLSVSMAGQHHFSQTIPYLIFSVLVWTIPARSILNHILISLISYSVIYNSPYFFFSVFLIWYTSFPVLLPRSLGFKSGGGNRTLLRVLDLGTMAFLDAKKPIVKGVSFLRFLTFNLPQFLAELALPLPAVPHDWKTGTVGTEFHVH